MEDKIEIYCPECLKQGRKKLLLIVGAETSGTLYPYCKIHKKQVKIALEPKSRNR